MTAAAPAPAQPVAQPVDDLVERLQYQIKSAEGGYSAMSDVLAMLREAAARIVALEAEKLELDRALDQCRNLLRLECESVEPLRSALAAAQADAERLLQFAGACLEPWPESLCDIDGEMQERFHKAGLTEQRIATEPGDDYEIGDEVYFLTELGKRALAARKVTP